MLPKGSNGGSTRQRVEPRFEVGHGSRVVRGRRGRRHPPPRQWACRCLSQEPADLDADSGKGGTDVVVGLLLDPVLVEGVLEELVEGLIS